jgi:HNH endonuclease
MAGKLEDVDVGTSRCVVAGTLDDPYSGARIEFRRAHADAVEINHVVPLAYAWTLDARMAFANDEALNLLVVASRRSAIGFG